MNDKKKFSTKKSLRNWIVFGSIVFALSAMLTLCHINQQKVPSNHCGDLCTAYIEIRRLNEENVDLRAKIALLEVKLEQKSIMEEPDSRHFYDCKPTKKGEMWTLAIHSYTRGRISTYYCMGHKGHTSLDRQVPEAKRMRLTCQETRP